MADKKISALPAATTPLAGTEVLPIVQSSTTDQVSVANLTAGRNVSMAKAFVGASDDGLSKLIVGGRASATDGTVIQYMAIPNGTEAYIGTGSNHPLNVAINGSTKWTYDTSFNLVPSVAAKGINFTANTPAAGMTSQLLNWYEEGTWTPTIGFSTSNGDLSYSVQVGTYTKIGNICVVQATLTFSETTASGNLRITNLPFTASNQTNITQGFGCYVDGMTGLSGAPVATITNNSTTMNFFYTGTGATSAITNSNTAAGSVIRFSASYRTL